MTDRLPLPRFFYNLLCSYRPVLFFHWTSLSKPTASSSRQCVSCSVCPGVPFAYIPSRNSSAIFSQDYTDTIKGRRMLLPELTSPIAAHTSRVSIHRRERGSGRALLFAKLDRIYRSRRSGKPVGGAPSRRRNSGIGAKGSKKAVYAPVATPPRAIQQGLGGGRPIST